MQIGVCFAQHGRKRPEIYMKGECCGLERGLERGGAGERLSAVVKVVDRDME